MKRNTADAQQAAAERQALVDSLPPCKVPKSKILLNLEADDALRAAAEQRAMSSHVPLGMYGDGVPYHRDPDPGNVKYESDDYAVNWYKNKNMVGIRQKKGNKDQIFAFGSKHSGLTEEEMKKLGDEALQKLDCGMSREEVKEWAMQAVAPWGSDDELLADVLFAWKKKMDECIHACVNSPHEVCILRSFCEKTRPNTRSIYFSICSAANQLIVYLIGRFHNKNL